MKENQKTAGVLATVASATLELVPCASDSGGGGWSSGASGGEGGLAGSISNVGRQFLEPTRGDALLQTVQADSKENAGATVGKVEIARADCEKTTSKQLGAGEAHKQVYARDGLGKGQDASAFRAADRSGKLGRSIDNSSAVCWWARSRQSSRTGTCPEGRFSVRSS